jgi:MFS family permease
MIAPMRHRQFRWQFTAQSISMLGSALAPVAVAFGVFAATGSAATLGWVMASYSVPMLLLVLAGGVWADRLPRHHVMMISNIVSGIAQLGFGLLLIAGHPALLPMMALQALGGAAAAFGMSAVLGLTASTAPQDLLQQANALLGTVGDVTGVLGPLLGSVLTVAIGGGWVLVLDGISFFACAALLTRVELPPVQREQRHFFRELREGWSEVIGRDWIWVSLCYFAFFNLVYGVFIVLGPAQFANRHNGAIGWGAVMAALSIGTLLGNLIALRLMPRYLLRWARLLELLVVPVILGLALGAPIWILTVSALLMGVAMTFPDALWFTALQQQVKPEALARVSSFDYLGSFALRPAGYALASVLIISGSSRSLIVIAVVFVAVTLASMISPGVRNLERALEPAAEKVGEPA